MELARYVRNGSNTINFLQYFLDFLSTSLTVDIHFENASLHAQAK